MTESTDDRSRARFIGCGIFRQEFTLLPPDMQAALQPTFFDSMLHMNPERLDELLTSTMDQSDGRRTVIAYGDCCPYMRELSSRCGTARTAGVNCCEIYLGSDRYRRLRKEGVFFLMPEWARRWKHIFMVELGLKDSRLAREFMAQSMKRAVYIDTGTVPVPKEDLDEFSAYTNLAVTIEPTGPEFFAQALRTALLDTANIPEQEPRRKADRG